MMSRGVMKMKTKSLCRIHHRQFLRSPYRLKDTVQITGPPVTEGFYF